MRRIDEQDLRAPSYGSRKMTALLRRSGEVVNRKRVRRLMRLDGPGGLHPRPRTAVVEPGARAYRDLLRDRVLTRVDEARGSDITHASIRYGFL